MRNFRNLSIIVALALLATIVANAQSSSPIKHFEKEIVAFDYPADWKLTDSSADEVQYFTLANNDSAVQIVIIVQPDPGIACASEARSRNVTAALVDRTANQIHALVPAQSSLIQTNIGPTKVAAVELHGVMNNQAVTAYVGSLVMHHFFINLVYLKTDSDESGTTAWETVRSSLKIAKPVPSPTGSGPPGSGGILNGKAIKLVGPEYPLAARRQRASGRVFVEVEIDESGHVTLACAISGDPLLQAASVAAARQSRFSPTKLSGKPVKVNGVIVYDFVVQ